jgi:hypothetical protein
MKVTTYPETGHESYHISRGWDMNLTTYTEAGFLKPISYPEAGT